MSTDWFILARKKERCHNCKGAGVLPYEDNARPIAEVTFELVCKKCDGKGRTIKKVQLTIDTLKELLK